MSKFVSTWRKLYTEESGTFLRLPLYVRALAAELLKFADPSGAFFVGEGEVDYGVYFGRDMRANAGERRMLRRDIPLLIEDGYLIRDGAYLRIRNWTHAQGSGPVAPANDSSTTRKQVANKSPTTGEQVANDSSASDERLAHDSSTKTDLSARSHSAGVRASDSDSEEKSRVDKNTDTPLAGAIDDGLSGDSKPDPKPAPSADEREVLTHWAATFYPAPRKQPVFDTNRRGKVRARLKEFSVADLKRAIAGCAVDPWHVEKKRHDISLICRDAAHVENFLRAAEEHAAKDGAGPSGNDLYLATLERQRLADEHAKHAVPCPPELAAKLAAVRSTLGTGGHGPPGAVRRPGPRPIQTDLPDLLEATK